jgi:AraC family transcriptional activator of mtrCDE
MSETFDTDPLSALLARLDFRARVFLRADFCGAWAVDTSGERRIPFHLVTRGAGWLHLPEHAPQPIKTGQLMVFPQDGPHLLAATDQRPDPAVINQGPPEQITGPVTRLVCGYFALDRQAAMPLLDGLPPILQLDVNASSPATTSLVQLWMLEAAGEELGADAAVDQLAQLVFIYLLRDEAARGGLHGVMGALADPRLGSVLAAIHRDPADGHTVVKLAGMAGMSSSAFSQRFKRVVGMTPAHYVRHWRLHAAARTLRETSSSMAEIAGSVGYDSEVAFRKAFSVFFGEAPGAMRRRHQKRF